MIDYNILDKFREYLLVNGRSYSTAQIYRARIEEFLRFEDSDDKVNKFILSLREKTKPATINGYINALKAYYKFMKIDYKFPQYAKVIKTYPDSFNEKYFEEEILYTIEQINSNPIKWKAILSFLYYTGIRIGEIDLIKRKDFDFVNKTIKVYIPKTREERIIFLVDKLIKTLILYFELDPEIDNAFNITSKQIKNYFYNLKSYFKDINFRPHLFRHAFATGCIRRGLDVKTTQEILGHKDIHSTEKYLGLNINEKKEIFLKKWNKKGGD